jgi:hypothetical protein
MVQKIWTEALQLPKIFTFLPTKPDNEGGVIFIWNSTALSRAKILLKDGSLQYMVSFRADEYKYII